jgi:hypothetical protein
MKLFRETLFKNIALLFFGWLVFYIDDKEFLNVYYTKWLILGLALFKTAFFFVQCIIKIFEASDQEVSYHHFLIFMGINIFLIIISFTIDFVCLYEVEPGSFAGFPSNLSFFNSCFELFYLSVLGFNNLGFYDVVPMGKASKLLVMTEIFAYIASIIFILSDFMSLKESLLELKKRREKA